MPYLAFWSSNIANIAIFELSESSKWPNMAYPGHLKGSNIHCFGALPATGAQECPKWPILPFWPLLALLSTSGWEGPVSPYFHWSEVARICHIWPFGAQISLFGALRELSESSKWLNMAYPGHMKGSNIHCFRALPATGAQGQQKGPQIAIFTTFGTSEH